MWQTVMINLLPSAVALTEKFILKREQLKPELKELLNDQLDLNKKIATDIDRLNLEVRRLKRDHRRYLLIIAALLIVVFTLLFFC
ncbi:MAG: hypothetical protein AAGA66_11480 [Bacteroidota bacterium]